MSRKRAVSASPGRAHANPLKFVNQVVNNVMLQINDLEAELSKAVYQDADAMNGESTSEEKQVFRELYEDVHGIKTKAAQSEALIQHIMSDAKLAEYTKSRLLNASVVVSYLRSLIAATNELEIEMAGNYSYASIAPLLQAANQQLSNLGSYSTLPKVVETASKITEIKTILKNRIFWSFRELGQFLDLIPQDPNAEPSSVGSNTGSSGIPDPYLRSVYEGLYDVSGVLNCLGSDIIEQLTDTLAQLQLLPYDKSGREGGVLYSLDKSILERRFSGLRRLLFVADSAIGVLLPTSYRLPHKLYVEFANRTKKHLLQLLTSLTAPITAASSTADLQNHAAMVVGAMTSVVKLEQEMAIRFEDASMEIGSTPSEELLLTQLQDGRLISAVFDPFLAPYLQLEKQALMDTTSSLLAADPINSSNSDESPKNSPPSTLQIPKQFESASRMFENIKSTMKRCLPLTNNTPFLTLTATIGEVLVLYASTLKDRVNGNSKKVDENLVSAVLNTADFCLDVLNQLENQIKTKIHEDLAEKVDFSAASEVFLEAVGASLLQLVSAAMDKHSDAFKLIRKTNWDKIDAVGDDSPYVSKFRDVFRESIPRVRELLSPVLFKNFCNKYAIEFMDTYYKYVTDARKISVVGAEQLLLDANSTTTLLLGLPNLGSNTNTKDAVYTSIVTTKMKQLVTILKLICTEEDQLEVMFHIMWQDGTDADLNMIRELKNPSGNRLTNAVGAVGEKTIHSLEAVGDSTTRATTKVIGAVGGTTSRATHRVIGAMGSVGSSSKHAFSAVGKATGSMTSKLKSKLKRSSHATHESNSNDDSNH